MQLQALILGVATTLSLATVATAASASATATTTSVKNKPSEAPILGGTTNVGCFNSSKGLEFIQTITFNSDGECSQLCSGKSYNVGATTGGSDCWCGNVYPPASSVTDDTECNFPCTGYGLIACGGLDTWSVYNTGLKLAVSNYQESSSTITSSAATATSTSAATTSTSSSDEDSGGSSKTVGIAVGAVAAVLVIAGAIGGTFWYIRKKRNQEIEEEHRRNAAVNAFINGSNPPGSSAGSISMTDSRLDPVLAHRRLSDGSIADNEDYSRKILRVTNA